MHIENKSKQDLQTLMIPPDVHERRMLKALKLAHQAFEENEVPVGAVLYCGEKLVGQAYNQVEMLNDPTAHAEMIAITQAASAVGDWRLTGTVLYVTKEPCPMCAGAIVLARIPLVVWGASDPARGGAVSVFNIFNHPKLNHQVEVIQGVAEENCRRLLQEFFQVRRDGGD